MQKYKRLKAVLVALVIFSLATMYAATPMVKAANLDSAKDTISDSEPEAVATHVFSLDLATELTAGQAIRIEFPTGFTGISNANATCPNGGVASTTGLVLDCVGAVASTSVQTLTLTTVGNPNTPGYYPIDITTLDTDLETPIDTSQVMVYIIEDVRVSATVNAVLEFTVGELGPDSGVTTVNGIAITASSSATSIPFGTLSSGVAATLGHSLAVSTNADDGFIVTVQQDGELTSGAGANINSFNNSPDGTGSTSPDTWDDPAGLIDQTHTYGHMGLTTDDADLGTDFTGSKYAGLNGTAAMTIMSHNNPADGTTQNAGLAHVAYTVKTTDLQEAGDYESYLTYICTPTY
jgi:hypothetical protein